MGLVGQVERLLRRPQRYHPVVDRADQLNFSTGLPLLLRAIDTPNIEPGFARCRLLGERGCFPAAHFRWRVLNCTRLIGVPAQLDEAYVEALAHVVSSWGYCALDVITAASQGQLMKD